MSGLHDLTVHTVARHTSLGSPAVAAHLQADQTLALAELLCAELSPIPLGFPVHVRQLQGEVVEHEASWACSCEDVKVQCYSEVSIYL